MVGNRDENVYTSKEWNEIIMKTLDSITKTHISNLYQATIFTIAACRQ